MRQRRAELRSEGQRPTLKIFYYSDRAQRHFEGCHVDSFEEIRNMAKELGKSAFLAGKTRASNPHNRPASLPSATGESVEQWQARSSSWFSGWDEACLAQGGTPPIRRSIDGRILSKVKASVASSPPADTKVPTTTSPDAPRRWYIRDKAGARRLTVFLMTQQEARLMFPGAEPGPAEEQSMNSRQR